MFGAVSVLNFVIFSSFTFASFSNTKPTFKDHHHKTSRITNEDYEHPSSLEVTGGVHDLVDLGVLERVAAGQPALLGEEPGDGDGLAEGRPLVLQQGQLSVRQ